MNDPVLAGLLNINKPAGLSSRRIVDMMERAAGTGRVGHAGTLDPLATGVLVVCVGSATRLIPYVQDQRKAYRAEFLFGQRSDTDDVTGHLSEVVVARPPTYAELDELLPRFRGSIEQVPPAYSAVHVAGQRAYQRARRGHLVKIEPRVVEVYRLELTAYCYPRAEFEIECGSGTYVRSIGRDLGELLGCGAVMSSLVRTQVGPFRLEDAVCPAECWAETVTQHLLPPLAAVANFPRHVCTDSDFYTISTGRPVRWREPSPPEVETVVLTGHDGGLVAITRYNQGNGWLIPQQVFVRHEATAR